jgi:hypothetical protein
MVKIAIAILMQSRADKFLINTGNVEFPPLLDSIRAGPTPVDMIQPDQNCSIASAIAARLKTGQARLKAINRARRLPATAINSRLFAALLEGRRLRRFEALL